jgi:hypothetical protein
MYFRLGGGTCKGISKPGWIVWSRIYIVGGKLQFDTGLAEVVQLPEEETSERWQQTTPQWPIMHAVLQGISRDQMMGRHKSNHVQVAGPRRRSVGDVYQSCCHAGARYEGALLRRFLIRRLTFMAQRDAVLVHSRLIGNFGGLT